jgi:N-acetylneuraminate lyase
MVTPFDEDDRLNLDAAGRLVHHLMDQGAGGLYICGSTGEAPLLDRPEREALTECVMQAARGRVPVIVQVGHTSPRNAVALARHAGRCGVDAISSVVPPFYPYTTEQVVSYWTDLAVASGLPFYGYIMHDVGASRDTVHRWVDAIRSVPNLAGLKITYADPYHISMLKECSGGALNVFAGWDQAFLGALAHGADGAIGTSYNVALPLWLAVYRLYRAGRTEAAARVMRRCAAVAGCFLRGFFLTRVKQVLQRQGFDCGRPRAPLRATETIPAAEIDELVRLIAAEDLDLGQGGEDPQPTGRRAEIPEDSGD